MLYGKCLSEGVRNSLARHRALLTPSSEAGSYRASSDTTPGCRSAFSTAAVLAGPQTGTSPRTALAFDRSQPRRLEGRTAKTPITSRTFWRHITAGGTRVLVKSETETHSV